jgi:hypothetical protein
VLLGFVPASAQIAQDAANKVDYLVNQAIKRCYSSVDGVRKISWEPPTEEDYAQIRLLGDKAVPRLAQYLNADFKDGFTQLIVVKFLITIGTSSTWDPLLQGFAKDQWEVTRAQSLEGLFNLSREKTKPLLETALTDDSPLVRQRAHDLLLLYPAP